MGIKMDIKMKVVIAADHSGFLLKENLRGFLEEQNYEVVDLGTDSETPVDYPDFAEKVGMAILKNEAERGVLICGSGVGAAGRGTRRDECAGFGRESHQH